MENSVVAIMAIVIIQKSQSLQSGILKMFYLQTEQYRTTLCTDNQTNIDQDHHQTSKDKLYLLLLLAIWQFY